LLSDIGTSLDPVRRKWNLFRLFSDEFPDELFWESLEETLVSGDVGIKQAEGIIRDLKEAARSSKVSKKDEATLLLAGILTERIMALGGTGDPVRFGPQPTVVILIGVNGSGKTTTAAKLAWNLQKDGKKVLIAAADTYRAAAADQLRIWAERSGTRVIAHSLQGEPGAVVYDAVQAAKAGGYDCLIIDTAGRVHTRTNLMEELSKIGRIIDKHCESWLTESLLVIDAVSGQNGFRQAEAFGRALSLTGAVITKYDHTAKGGIILSVGSDLGLPVRYVGLGEGIEDLRLFDPAVFVDALLGISRIRE
jgi:fused signal recognition particle receptor